MAAGCPEGSVMISKDEDFARRVYLGRQPPAKVVWLRLGNCRNAHLRQVFEGVLPRDAAINQ